MAQGSTPQFFLPDLGLIDRVVFTGSGTFTKGDYPGATHFRVICVGGGGAGGGAVSTGAGQSSCGSGGGGGALAMSLLPAASLAASETVTVGSGGTPVSAADGGDGSDSSFGSHVVADGGSGGFIRGLTTGDGLIAGGAQGQAAASTGDFKLDGNGGQASVVFASGMSGSGIAGGGGASGMGSGASRDQFLSGTGLSGGPYGGGGGGIVNPQSQGSNDSGGAGGSGVVIVEVYSQYRGSTDDFVTTTPQGQVLIGDGTTTAPGLAFGTNQDTGLWKSLDGYLDFTVDGTTSLSLTPGQLQALDGTEAAPSVSFFTDPDSGLRKFSANDISLVASGTDIARYSLTGIIPADSDVRNLGTSSLRWDTLYLSGAKSTGDLMLDMGNYEVYVDNTGPGASGDRLWIDGPDNGAVYIGPRAGASHLDTFEVRANTFLLDSDGVNGTIIRQGSYASWTAVTFQNSWVNYGGSFANAAYRLLPDGRVELRGLVKGGTLNANIFILPTGLRPAETLLFTVSCQTNLGRLDITATGGVYIHDDHAIGNGFVSLSGVCFDPS